MENIKTDCRYLPKCSDNPECTGCKEFEAMPISLEARIAALETALDAILKKLKV